MGTLLVHITHGPESPTRAALGCLVAKAAVDAGHDVTLFLAGDGAYLAKREVVANLTGLGTGSVADSMAALVEAGSEIFVSGMSAKARGVSDDDLEAVNGSFAMPAKLVELTFANDRVLVY